MALEITSIPFEGVLSENPYDYGWCSFGTDHAVLTFVGYNRLKEDGKFDPDSCRLFVRRVTFNGKNAPTFGESYSLETPIQKTAIFPSICYIGNNRFALGVREADNVFRVSIVEFNEETGFKILFKTDSVSSAVPTWKARSQVKRICDNKFSIIKSDSQSAVTVCTGTLSEDVSSVEFSTYVSEANITLYGPYHNQARTNWLSCSRDCDDGTLICTNYLFANNSHTGPSGAINLALFDKDGNMVYSSDHTPTVDWNNYTLLSFGSFLALNDEEVLCLNASDANGAANSGLYCRYKLSGNNRFDFSAPNKQYFLPSEFGLVKPLDVCWLDQENGYFAMLSLACRNGQHYGDVSPNGLIGTAYSVDINVHWDRLLFIGQYDYDNHSIVRSEVFPHVMPDFKIGYDLSEHNVIHKIDGTTLALLQYGYNVAEEKFEFNITVIGA